MASKISIPPAPHPKNIDFQCTKCGDCCRGFWLPLSLGEATSWLRNGHKIDLLCEAIPWTLEPDPSNLESKFKRERSFPAKSGQMNIRVLVTLAAPLGSGCPNLSNSNSCGIYERRPTACRIYPAEFNPFLKLIPEQRRCPPSAWMPPESPLIRDGAYVSHEMKLLIDQRLKNTIADTPKLSALSKRLGINEASLANEGYMIYSFDPVQLLTALTNNYSDVDYCSEWSLISDNQATIETLVSCEAKSFHASQCKSTRGVYISRR